MDLFSFGLVMWRIIYRERPRSKLEEIADGIAPDTVHLTDNGLAPHPRAPSDHYFEFLGLRELYNSCTHRDPKARPNFGDVISRLTTLYSEWQAKSRTVKEIFHPTYNLEPQ